MVPSLAERINPSKQLCAALGNTSSTLPGLGGIDEWESRVVFGDGTHEKTVVVIVDCDKALRLS